MTASATQLARRLVASLTGAGVRHVVLCPGSRSAPLAYAVHDLADTGALELHVRHDERVAGFTALGLGRADGVPAAVVTTSGTAVANLLPAVLEAHHAGVPLLVLAADRPPRLRGTWANQTSDRQAELFGAATRLTEDLTAQDGLAVWAAAGQEAVEVAGGRGGRPGPVHLNLAFDDPLVPDADDAVWPADPDELLVAPAALPVDADPVEPGRVDLDLTPGTVVVAGDRAGPVARQVAEALRLPLLAEPTSGARAGAQAVGPYRLLLDHPRLGGRVDQALVFGRPDAVPAGHPAAGPAGRPTGPGHRLGAGSPGRSGATCGRSGSGRSSPGSLTYGRRPRPTSGCGAGSMREPTPRPRWTACSTAGRC